MFRVYQLTYLWRRYLWKQGDICRNKAIFVETRRYLWKQGDICGNKAIFLETRRYLLKEGDISGKKAILLLNRFAELPPLVPHQLHHNLVESGQWTYNSSIK